MFIQLRIYRGRQPIDIPYGRVRKILNLGTEVRKFIVQPIRGGYTIVVHPDDPAGIREEQDREIDVLARNLEGVMDDVKELERDIERL